MTNAHPRGSRSATPAVRGRSRTEHRALRTVVNVFVALVLISTLVEIGDRVTGDDDYFFVEMTFVPALGALLYGMLLRRALRGAASRSAATARPRPAGPRAARPGMVPDDQLTPEQQLVRKHFPGAMFETAERKRASAAASEQRMSRYTPPPKPRRDVAPLQDWHDAERSAAQWMRDNGYSDAKKTRPGPDGGVDVNSTRAVAQVKHQAQAVGSKVIRELSGVTTSSRHHGKKALFSSTYGYSKHARQTARDMGVELYQHSGSGWVRTD